jgi:hypothetical protein
MMKKILVSALISCGLLAAVQTNGQSFGQNGEPVLSTPAGYDGFYAHTQNNIVIMRWNAENESDVDHYVVEHSTDSVNFDPLHEVVSKGAGTGDSSSYEDADAYPKSPVNYYRLTTVTKEGNSFSSPAVRVDIDPGRTPVLVPTVLNQGAMLRMDNNYRDKLLIVDFFTISGQLIKSYEVNSSSFIFNTTGWSRGLIIYRISDETHPMISSGKILME